MLRRLVDPNYADLRSPPWDERALVVAASNGRVVALDNVSTLDADLADALCRVATGGGFSERALYTHRRDGRRDGADLVRNVPRAERATAAKARAGWQHLAVCLQHAPGRARPAFGRRLGSRRRTAAGSPPACASPLSAFAAARAASGEWVSGLPIVTERVEKRRPVVGSVPRGL
jgi:hypothetical protein